VGPLYIAVNKSIEDRAPTSVKADPDDFQNLAEISLSKDTFLVKFSWRSKWAESL